MVKEKDEHIWIQKTEGLDKIWEVEEFSQVSIVD